MVLGIVLIVVGVIVMLGDRFPIRIGHLPGDIVIRGKNSVFYFPLATCIVLSVLFTLVMWLFNRR